MRIFSLTATVKRLLNQFGGRRRNRTPRRVFPARLRKNRIPARVPERSSVLRAPRGGKLPPRRRCTQYSLSPGLKSDILSGKTGPQAATSRFIAYRAVPRAAKMGAKHPLTQSRPIIIHYPCANCKGFLKKTVIFLRPRPAPDRPQKGQWRKAPSPHVSADASPAAVRQRERLSEEGRTAFPAIDNCAFFAIIRTYVFKTGRDAVD